MSVKHLMATYYFRHNSEIWNLHHTFECYAIHFRLLGKMISIHRRMLMSCLYTLNHKNVTFYFWL